MRPDKSDWIVIGIISMVSIALTAIVWIELGG